MPRPVLLSSLMSLTLVACGAQDKSTNAHTEQPLACKILPSDRTEIKPAPSGKLYFPASFGDSAVDCSHVGFKCLPLINEIELDWYAKHWDAANEPSMFELSRTLAKSQRESIRFTWLRTFHAPVMVRIERTGDAAAIVAKQLSGQGGYDPGIVERTLSRSLTPDELARLNAMLKETAVFSETPKLCNLGLDGSQWIVERASADGYKFVNRWSPESGSVRVFGDFALGLTGWKFEERY